MSIHIGAKPSDIAPSILLPGDPLRAKFIAETLLEGATCFNPSGSDSPPLGAVLLGTPLDTPSACGGVVH